MTDRLDDLSRDELIAVLRRMLDEDPKLKRFVPRPIRGGRRIGRLETEDRRRIRDTFRGDRVSEPVVTAA